MRTALCATACPSSSVAKRGSGLPARRAACAAAAKQPPSQQPEASTSAPSQAPAPAGAAVQPVTREFRALGSKVVESNVAFSGPEDQQDFWEGERFENLGKALENYFIPSLLVLGLVCGGIAAKTYNEDATTYIKPPTGPDAEASIIVAPELLAGSSSAPSISSE